GDTDADELQSFCKARLADFKVPAVIRIMPALPKNAVGKVDLRRLAAQFAPSHR
ncbi:MAG: AMP-binding enzyme C-terminal domain, partial [Actinomycetia bacterium]|nr:AMP-binding enzyme C-terminal domain [Actinomycetes bacterium]